MANVRTQLSTALNQFYHQPVARVSVELFLSLGAVMFFALFAIRPTLLTMSDLVKEIQDKKSLDAKLGQKIAALYSAQSEYLTLQNRLPLLDEAIPNSPQLIHTLKIVEKLASDRRLVITNIQVNDIPAETEAVQDSLTAQRQTLPVRLTVAGDYPTIRSFIEDMKSIRRVLTFESVAFSNSEEHGKKTLKAQVVLGLPYYGDKP